MPVDPRTYAPESKLFLAVSAVGVQKYACQSSMSGGAGNIAWLLLETAVTTSGPDGDRLSGITWVQRLNTSGGIAPAGACTPGDTAAVSNTTDYVFWKSTGDE